MRNLISPLVPAAALLLTLLPTANSETIGGGAIVSPAVAPAQSFGIGGAGFVPVKNWNFGSNGTIRNYTDMNANFYYHDQFGTIANGNYGAKIVAPDTANALAGQPIEGANTGGLPVRQFLADSLKTFLVPLNGATTVTPASLNTGSGSFMAKWKLPRGGSLLNQDIVFETRVRYVTPPYYWFAIWTAGNQWNGGAEMDVVESFGYDNTSFGGSTNYIGRFWHSDVVGGGGTVSYSNWGAAMNSCGISTFDATQYHTWTWLYRRDNTFVAYMDGIPVQYGTTYWTYGADLGANPVDMGFLFDGTWGSRTVSSCNHSLAASALVGKYYEWDYSRVYLRSSYGTAAQINETESQIVAATSGDAHTRFTDTYFSMGSGTSFGANAVNDYLTYRVYVPEAKTYNIKLKVKKYNSRGIYQLAIASTLGGTYLNQGAAQDLYSSGSVLTELDLGSCAFSTPGDRYFRLKVTGKNASSSGYVASLDYIKLVPQ